MTATVNPLHLVYSIADSVLRATQHALPAAAVADFVHSVRWGEPFIYALLLSHVALASATYMTRRNTTIQFMILTIMTLLTMCGRMLNEMGRRHWRLFASQDYFDSAGLFMVTFIYAPFVILGNFIVLGLMLRIVKLYALRSRRQSSSTNAQHSKTS